MKLYANLHTHSTHSDGVYTAAELVKVAKGEGYKAIALTDHDTVTGFSALRSECEKEGLDCVFGAEFTSPSKELHANFHIVGFHFDPEYAPMKEYLTRLSFTESNQTKVLFDRGICEGLITGITWQEVLEFNSGITWLCNEHVFRAMKAKGLKKDIDYGDFFNSVYGVRRGQVPPAYPFLTPENLIHLIRDAGGFAVLAHPHNQLCHLDKLINMGLEGLEVWHNILTAEERKEALTLAMRNKLYISGGSDHSGLCGGQYARYEHPEQSPHYAEPCSLGTTKEFFEEIKNRKLSSGREEIIKSFI